MAQKTDNGEKKLGTIGAGDVVGEFAFIDERPRSATVTVGETAQLLKLDHAKVMRSLVDNPEALAELLQALAVRVTLRLRSYMSEQSIQDELSKVSDISDTPAPTGKTGAAYLE